jgi:hypothetical protein
MKIVILIVVSMLAKNLIFGQENNSSYYKIANKAQSLYNEKNYLESAKCYSQLINRFKPSAQSDDYYNGACSWSLANLPDSAFLYLNRVVNEKKYANVDHIVSDEDLKALHNDKRWKPLIEQVKSNKTKVEKGYNIPVVRALDSIYQFDQGGRSQVDSIEKKFGRTSEEVKKYLTTLNLQDSLNIIKVTSIIDKYGWLGPDKVGERGNTTLFLVVQHADKEVHLKYLPILRQAVKLGKAKSQHLALLEDRTALEEGKKQIYGSQIVRDPKTGKPVIAPMEDEKDVDVRREGVGLGPLKEYAKFFHIDYVPKSQ